MPAAGENPFLTREMHLTGQRLSPIVTGERREGAASEVGLLVYLVCRALGSVTVQEKD